FFSSRRLHVSSKRDWRSDLCSSALDEFPLPDLVLLDLKMPRRNGYEVLKWIRNNADLRALRVVVLTSSQDLRDVNFAYELGANRSEERRVGKEGSSRGGAELASTSA